MGILALPEEMLLRINGLLTLSDIKTFRQQEEWGTHLQWLTEFIQNSNIDTLVFEGRDNPSVSNWQSQCKPGRRRTAIAAKRLLAAASHVNQKIKTVRLRGVAFGFCKIFDDVQDDIYQFMKHVETFELDVLEHFDAHAAYPGIQNPAHRYDERSITGRELPAFLEQASELRVVRLCLPRNGHVELGSVLGTYYYPRLTWINLGGIKASITTLKVFLSDHKNTLRWIYLTDMRLTMESDPSIPLGAENWVEFFILMSGRLPECRKFICNGRLSYQVCSELVFKDHGNSVMSKSTWLVDQYVRQPQEDPAIFKAKLDRAGRCRGKMVIVADPEEPEQLRRV
ncbi:hypothetical protein MBLNU457_g2563t1 [Dothideomycetes sp. NU457]